MSETIGRLLAAGNVAEIFEWGSCALKLYKSNDAKLAAFREAAIRAAAETLGYQFQRSGASKRSAIGGGSCSTGWFNRHSPDDITRYLECMVQLHLRIHAHEAIHLASLKVRLAANIAATKPLDEPRKHRLLAGVADMPDGDRLCHGDFHPMNILGDPSQPVIIDWPDARRGDPAADVCRSYLLLKLHVVEIATPYLDAYCRINGVAQRSVLRWLPYVEGAKLAEGVPSELDGLIKIVRSSRFN